MPVRMTRDLAHRAGVDYGNRSMYAAGRAAWDEDDYNAAMLMFNTLWPLCPHRIDPDDWCFFCDGAADDMDKLLDATRERARLSSQTIC